MSRCLFIRTIMQIKTHKYGHGEMRNKDGSSAVINIALEKEGKKKVIATRGIRILSPTQVLTSPNRA